jgi:ribosomal protein L40E
MSPELVTPIVCPDCGAELPPAARVCPRCGAATPARASDPPAAHSAARSSSLLDRPWFILCLLFFVTAILGVPLLWISRGFSLAWKIVLSVVVTLYTALLLWGFWWIMDWSLSRIMDSLS